MNHNPYVTKGLEFLKSRQLNDGSFVGDSFSAVGDKHGLPTVFDTSVILCALEPLKKELIESGMVYRAVSFLQLQRNNDGSCNYWKIGSDMREIFPYPNDMDDTALLLAALAIYSPKTIDGAVYAQIAHLLTTTEIQVGGPYNTWICDWKNDNRWHDQDTAVNANIAFLLSKIDIELPNLIELFESSIQSKNLESKYYSSVIIILYFIARSYSGEMKQEIIDMILDARTDDHFGNPLLASLAISTLIRLGVHITHDDPMVVYLQHTQSEDGSWNREKFFIDPSTRDVVWYHGSSELTTACCIEALYLIDHQTVPAAVESSVHDEIKDEVIGTFIKEAYAESKLFGELAEKSVAQVLTYSISYKSMLLPFFMRDALGEKSQHIDHSILIWLGIANLAGWVGYTITDDVVDGDRTADLLPFAAWCIRNLTARYAGILGHQYAIANSILSGIEIAQFQEQKNRLTKSEQGYSIEILPHIESIPTFEKSLGHALPALSVALLSGIKSDSDIYTTVQNFFIHYLSARQYNDDAHDIMIDLSRGTVTPPIYSILTRYKILYPDETVIIPASIERTVRELFWNDVFDETYETIEHHIQSAENALRKLNMQDDHYFFSLIQELKTIQKRTKDERVNTLQFIRQY